VTDNPVLLLHGLATSSERSWRDNGWIDLLADAGREVLAIDLLGHGAAPKPHDPAAYDELESRVLDALPTDTPVDGIGFSLGARVLLTLASEHPDRFGRIVLTGVGANLFRDANEADTDLIADAILGQVDHDNPMAQYFARLADAPDADPEALAAYLRRPHHRPLHDDKLRALTLPVLVVLGDRDFAGPADPLMERLPHARLVTLPGVDHFSTPKDFGCIDAALEFLGALPG
jgi:pimeloyl-ACP methyl ester carboxylesterase